MGHCQDLCFPTLAHPSDEDLSPGTPEELSLDGAPSSADEGRSSLSYTSQNSAEIGTVHLANDSALSLKSLRKAFADVVAVDGIDLEVERGSVSDFSVRTARARRRPLKFVKG